MLPALAAVDWAPRRTGVDVVAPVLAREQLQSPVVAAPAAPLKMETLDRLPACSADKERVGGRDDVVRPGVRNRAHGHQAATLSAAWRRPMRASLEPLSGSPASRHRF